MIRTYFCMFVCLYVCINVCMYVYIYKYGVVRTGVGVDVGTWDCGSMGEWRGGME
jgi:hypothetical protein